MEMYFTRILVNKETPKSTVERLLKHKLVKYLGNNLEEIPSKVQSYPSNNPDNMAEYGMELCIMTFEDYRYLKNCENTLKDIQKTINIEFPYELI